jgi:ribosomal protein L37E
MEKVNCARCGTDNPENYKYCSNCGYELPKIKTEEAAKVQQPITNQTEKRKKLFGIFVGVVVFGLSYFAVQQLFLQANSYDKAMMKVASEINKSCPIMVDSETRLDNAISLPRNFFQYNYTLLNIDIETADTVAMKNYLRPTITTHVKTSPQMKFLKDHMTNINYYYKDKNGKYLFLITILPANYK